MRNSSELENALKELEQVSNVINIITTTNPIKMDSFKGSPDTWEKKDIEALRLYSKLISTSSEKFIKVGTEFKRMSGDLNMLLSMYDRFYGEGSV